MSLLTALGMLSMALVAAFTCYNYRNNTGAGQTPRWAIIESWIHIAVGFSINMALNQLMFPLMTEGATLTLTANWWGGWVYTLASLVRTFLIRRASNALHHAGS